MKHQLKLICTLLAFTFLISVSVQAQTREKIFIALEADDIDRFHEEHKSTDADKLIVIKKATVYGVLIN